MDSCFADITTEFLSVAFHSILYYASVYPTSIFEPRRKYNVVVYRSIHPEVNEYIDMCLKSAAECLKSGQLDRIEFAVTDAAYEVIFKVVFDINKNEYSDDNTDAYLIQAEQNFRALCLNLSSISDKCSVPEDCSFSVSLHTNESTAVALSNDSNLENFPLVEINHSEELNRIIPLRRFNVRNVALDAYIEIK